MTNAERTRYIQDAKGRFIPTNIVGNPQKLKDYLHGYGRRQALPSELKISVKRTNTYNYGSAVYEEKHRLKSYDGGRTFLSPKLKNPTPMRESEVRDLEDNVTLLTQQVGKDNPSFVPRWAFSNLAEGEMQPNYDFSRSYN